MASMSMCAKKQKNASKYGMMDTKKSSKLPNKMLDKFQKMCYNKGTKEKEMQTMNYYEIRDTKNGGYFTTTAKTFQEACKKEGRRPQDCRLCFKCDAEDAPQA